jgi:hypothetical protein
MLEVAAKSLAKRDREMFQPTIPSSHLPQNKPSHPLPTTSKKKPEPFELLGKPFRRNFLDLCHQRTAISLAPIDLRLHGRKTSDEF